MDVPGALVTARSLGDTVAHSAGVISEPEFTSHTFSDADKYLVCASDGLWEFMADQEVIDIMATQTEPRRSVDLLVMGANGRWMKEEQVIDDTAVIVAHLVKPN
jgi:serine/threonine protein phosphatase PrpC